MRLTEAVRRHPVFAYFALAFAISWVGCVAAVGPKFLRGEPTDWTDALSMFLPMLIGPSIAGISVTAIVDGRIGLRELLSRMTTWRVGLRWYAASVLIPPLSIIAVLSALSTLVSPEFAPRFVPMAILIGVLAGFFEEIGWTGCAYPRMALRQGALAAAVYLGLVWTTWHLAADYMGSSATLGAYWFPHFLAFMTVSMTAMRVLISWVYCNTASVLLAQLMHASSTGSLAVLGPTLLSPMQDTLWYAVYAIVLWVVVAIVAARSGRTLMQRSRAAETNRSVANRSTR